MISLPPAKMTEAQLEARIRIHEATAAAFVKAHETSMAKQFRELAAVYRKELESRVVNQKGATAA